MVFAFLVDFFSRTFQGEIFKTGSTKQRCWKHELWKKIMTGRFCGLWHLWCFQACWIRYESLWWSYFFVWMIRNMGQGIACIIFYGRKWPDYHHQKRGLVCRLELTKRQGSWGGWAKLSRLYKYIRAKLEMCSLGTANMVSWTFFNFHWHWRCLFLAVKYRFSNIILSSYSSDWDCK